MKVLDTKIPDVKIIEPTVYRDERGHFLESYNAQKFREAFGFKPEFCQTNESFSKKGTIRGLHFQKEPFAQAKLVRVIVGKVLDVVVDCRPESSSFGQHVAVELSAKNYHELWIPKGFAHGFQVLSETTVLNYQVDAPYMPTAQLAINPFDKYLNVSWNSDLNLTINDNDRHAAEFLSVFDKGHI